MSQLPNNCQGVVYQVPRYGKCDVLTLTLPAAERLESYGSVSLICYSFLCTAVPYCTRVSYTSVQARAVHSISGKNLFVTSHRHRCYNPGCAGVKMDVITAMTNKTTETLPKVYDSGHLRDLTDDEQQRMRRGDISSIAPSVIKTLLSGGRSFSVMDYGYVLGYDRIFLCFECLTR